MRAGSVSRQKFTQMVKEALAQNGSSMTSAEVDLLFRALDTNKCDMFPPHVHRTIGAKEDTL